MKVSNKKTKKKPISTLSTQLKSLMKQSMILIVVLIAPWQMLLKTSMTPSMISSSNLAIQLTTLILLSNRKKSRSFPVI